MIYSTAFWAAVLFLPRVLADATYDYVIIGGGTAGLTLAARLTEDNFASVAVIEAGTYYQIVNPLLSSTPAGDVFFIGSSPADTNPGVDWGFVTSPQESANNRSFHYPRGKCLGGSSGRNFLLYQRADKGSLQQWADAVDDQSYTFDNLLPYYQKSVNFTPPASSRFANATTKFNATAFSSTGGPLQVSYPAYAEPYATWAGAGFEDIGIPIADDFNSGTVMGSQWASTTIDPYTAFRSSSQTSFLNQSQARPNLKVFELTMAKKIVFNNTTAIGVEIDSGITLFANKEVIVSAGAFQSPQLLMVSGIGPAAVLEALNISVIADLPGVGQNLTDHIMFGPTYQILVETLGSLITNPASLLASLIYEYLPYATGPLTSGQTSYLAWEKVPRDLISNASAAALANIPASWPELEYLVSPDYAGNYSNTLTDAPANLNSYGALGVGLVAPLSRGEVTITSIDTSILPTVNPNWLAHPTDRDVAIAGYKRARAFFASDAIAPLLANATEAFPGPQVKTDAQILNAIRNGMQTLYHAACTCRMGRKGDSTAVVDTRARVFGVERLRVVDSSSFALLPPGHPQSLVYALAEKIAAEIKLGL